MKKLLNKKGFTMVELIVVIALMALLLAIVIPMLSTTDARKNEVREYARSFYSNVQELMIDEKLAKNPLPGGDSTKYVLVGAKVDENDSTYDGVKISMAYTNADPVAGVVSFDNLEELVDDTAGNDRLELTTGSYTAYAEFGNSLRKLLLGNERSGVYFAIVDDKYRVVSTYFVEAADNAEDFDAIFTAVRNKTFTDDFAIDGRFAGAWPEELAESGRSTFSIPS